MHYRVVRRMTDIEKRERKIRQELGTVYLVLASFDSRADAEAFAARQAGDCHIRQEHACDGNDCWCQSGSSWATS